MKFPEKPQDFTSLQLKLSQNDSAMQSHKVYLCVNLGHIFTGVVGIDDLTQFQAETEASLKSAVLFADPKTALAYIKHPLCEKKWAGIEVEAMRADDIMTEQGIKKLSGIGRQAWPTKKLNGAWVVSAATGDILVTGNMPILAAANTTTQGSSATAGKGFAPIQAFERLFPFLK